MVLFNSVYLAHKFFQYFVVGNDHKFEQHVLNFIPKSKKIVGLFYNIPIHILILMYIAISHLIFVYRKRKKKSTKLSSQHSISQSSQSTILQKLTVKTKGKCYFLTQ